MKAVLSLLAFFSILQANAQAPPESFFKGLELVKTDPVKARTYLFQAVGEDSLFYGSYNFLGVIHEADRNYDSAIYYLQAAVRLNKDNPRHTREFSLARLCRLYTRTANFEAAYQNALQASTDYPENSNFLYELREACLWAYHIQYAGLKKEYLDPQPLPSYLVNGVSQEYLIMRNLMVDGFYLDYASQHYLPDSNTDVLSCSYGKEGKKIDLKFVLAWNVLKTMEDKMPDYEAVYKKKDIAIYYRIGALLSHDSKVDIIKEIRKLER